MAVAFPSGSDLRRFFFPKKKKKKKKNNTTDIENIVATSRKKVGHAIFSSAKFRDNPAICLCKDEKGTRQFI